MQDHRTQKPSEASPAPRTVTSLDLPEDTLARLDPELRTALELVLASDWPVLRRRTGLEHGRGDQSLPLFIELAPVEISTRALQRAFEEFGLAVAEFWYHELARRPAGDEMPIVVPAQLRLAAGDLGRTDRGSPLVEALARIAHSPFVRRVRLATPHPRCLESSLEALDWPASASEAVPALRGKDIVIGIIDEGCAFAHHDFLVAAGRRGATLKTRVLRLWDQSRAPTAAEQASGWDGSKVPYGREIDAASMNRAIAAHVERRRVDESAVYAALGYELGEPGAIATHGTAVMSIAAGNGRALMGRRGVAPEADLVFVHLPPVDVDVNGSVLGNRIADAAAYVFDRAQKLGKKAAVVNISYGGYRGAHDGTNAAELALDTLLATRNRAIVVSAGNGFEADCHAMRTLAPGASADLAWQLLPEDPTTNDVELWYEGASALRVTLVPPDGAPPFGPFGFESSWLARPGDGRIIGRFEHTQHDARNGDNVALIALRSTDARDATSAAAPAPAGAWTIRLENVGSVDANVHAWIARDDLGGPGARRQQSRFARELARPDYTIGDLASGRRTIAVGAFNAATSEMCRYSACGPTRASGAGASRAKPEVCAPAEEDAAGRGVLAAASGRAQPRRFNGTSAAAPHVAGIVALAFDLARNVRYVDLDTATLRAALAGQPGSPLVPNRHLDADDTRPVKHEQVMNDLIGIGKISLERTLANV